MTTSTKPSMLRTFFLPWIIGTLVMMAILLIALLLLNSKGTEVGVGELTALVAIIAALVMLDVAIIDLVVLRLFRGTGPTMLSIVNVVTGSCIGILITYWLMAPYMETGPVPGMLAAGASAGGIALAVMMVRGRKFDTEAT